jgi:hypothetical protein
MKDSVYKELEYVFYIFSKYYMEIFVRRFYCQSRQGNHSNINIWE